MPDLSFNLWPEWHIDHVIGNGSYGNVYEIHRWNGEILEKAALKVITIPQGREELEQLRMDGLGEENTESYFAGRVEEIRNEIGVMQRFVGNSNIVSYEDYRIDRHEGEIRWDILIRMELLTPLTDYIRSHPMSEDDVIRLGKDICHALSLCHEAGIIHRDIKPQNIFVNKWGFFKLGDFGIARTMPGSGSVLSFKGTIPYMAPETFKMLNTDARSDIYSLALVLYQILNGGREPFLASSEFTLQDKEEAQRRRISGEVIPPPEGGSRKLWDVLSIALREDPSSRYQTAEAFCKALEKAGNKSSHQARIDETKGLFPDEERKDADSLTSKFGVEDQNRLYDSGEKNKDSFYKYVEGSEGDSSKNRTTLHDGEKREDRNKRLFFWIICATAILIITAGTVTLTYRVMEYLSKGSEKDDSGIVQSTDVESSEESEGVVAEDNGEEQQHDEDDVETIQQVSYSLICLDLDGNIIRKSNLESSGEDQAGKTIRFTAPDIEGYTLVDENEKEIILSEKEDENQIVFTYSKDPDSVVYNTEGKVRILNRKSDKKNGFEYLARRFEKESGIRVTVDTPGSSKYSSVLNEQITGNSDGPTLFMISGMKDFEKYGYECFDLSDSEAASEICDEAYTLKGKDGRIYGLACMTEAFGITVNTRLLSEAGYSIQDIQSFSDLKRISEDISSRRNELGFAAFTTPTIGISSNGNYRLSQHASVVPLFYELQDNGFHTEKELEGTYLDGLQNYIDLCLNNSVGSFENEKSFSLEDSRKEFIDCKAVFHQDGSWAYEALQGGLGEDMSVIPMYMGMPGERRQALNETCSNYWCVNKNASYNDIMATLQFLKWLVTSEEGLEIMEADLDFQIPYKKAHIPDNVYLLTLQKQKEEGLTPVLQYYNRGNEESWRNSLINAIYAYASGTSGWQGVIDAFTTLW